MTTLIGTGPPPGFDDPPAVLRRAHAQMRALLGQLAEGLSLPLLDRLRAELRQHTDDEEFSVYPRIANETTHPLIAAMTDEHRACEAILLAALTAAKNEREAALHVHALAAALGEHMDREEDTLYPAVDALGAAEKRAIGLEMRLRRQ